MQAYYLAYRCLWLRWQECAECAAARDVEKPCPSNAAGMPLATLPLQFAGRGVVGWGAGGSLCRTRTQFEDAQCLRECDARIQRTVGSRVGLYSILVKGVMGADPGDRTAKKH